MSIKNDNVLSHCAETVKSFDRDRFLSVLFAPAECREALMTLYAFNHELAKVRETVSEPLIGRMRLQFWRDALEDITKGVPPKHPVVEPLSEVIQRFELQKNDLLRVVEHREWDLDDVPPATLEKLTEYAEGTASSVIALSLKVLGANVPDDTVRKAGIAQAMIGLALSLPYQAAAGRVTLPANLCHQAGLSPTHPNQWPEHPDVSAIVVPMLELAENHLKRVRVDRLPKNAMPAFLPLSAASRQMIRLRKVGNDPYALVGKPAVGYLPLYLMWRYLLRRP